MLADSRNQLCFVGSQWIHPGALPGQKMLGGHTWRAHEAEPITGVWGRSPQRGPGAATYGSEWQVKLQTMTDPSPLLPSKISPDLHQSQERPLAKVGWTCPPQSTPW